jgi:hypothetical protein
LVFCGFLMTHELHDAPAVFSSGKAFIMFFPFVLVLLPHYLHGLGTVADLRLV